MKNLISLLLLVVSMVLSTAGTAQNATQLPLVAGDTLAMSASSDTVTKVIRGTAGYSAFTIQVVMTRLSGTAVGKAYLEGSLDGVNYILTDSSDAFANQVTNTAAFLKNNTHFTHYRLRVRPMGGATGTQSSVVRVWVVFRKHD